MDTWQALGALLASLMFFKTIANEFMTVQLVSNSFARIAGVVYPYMSIIVEQYDNEYSGELYELVQIYLSNRCINVANKVKLSKGKDSRSFVVSMEKNEKVVDEYRGVKLWWTLHSIQTKQEVLSGERLVKRGEKQSLELCFHRKHKDAVLEHYIPHLIEEAKALKVGNRRRKLYTNAAPMYSSNLWTSVTFDHPATFDTLAIHPQLKQDIIQDLAKFSSRQQYYQSVGRAWKRGYLLYGPPGTGKSSMIAAIANFLKYDIYDLELTAVTSNTELRRLLISTGNKSIIVIEDIDCSLDLSDRNREKKPPPPPLGVVDGESKLTLSGVLNFTDGLWSCCGSERLIIFTTNHVDSLDPALLRSGRMDRHLHLSYCTFPTFRILARNYLGVEDHQLFHEVQRSMTDSQITPSDVTEVLLRDCEHPTSALENLIRILRRSN